MLCAACGEATDTAPCSACGGEPVLHARYALLSVLGQGGLGTTYRARCVDDDRIVAIKELPLRTGATAKHAELFEREARVLKQLNHPGIPAHIDDFGAGKGKHRAMYLVQRHVDGVDLERSLEHRRYSVPDVLKVLGELFEVLAYLHELSPPVVHRDVKPRNLVRESGTGQLFLVDFGAVRDALKDEDLGGSTVAGTFGFMAPEQFMGAAAPATDLYGAGATAVALLCRKPLNSLLDTHRRLDWKPHVQVAPPVAQLLEDLLAPEPDRRPASARVAAERVRDLLSTEAWNAPELPAVRSPVPTALAPIPAAQGATLASVFLGGQTELAIDRIVPGVLRTADHARAMGLIEQALGMPSGRLEAVGELFRWASPTESPRMVRISVVDQGDGTSRIQIWERLSGRAGSLFGGLVGGLGGGVGGGFAWAFIPLGPAAVGAYLGTMLGGSYLLARTLFARTERRRRAQLAEALDALTHFLAG